MRRAVAFGLLALGILVGAASASSTLTAGSAQTATSSPPTTTTASTSSTSPSTLPKAVTAGGSGDRLPTLGEGFPWIPVGAVILVAGLVGARLRRASRR